MDTSTAFTIMYEIKALPIIQILQQFDNDAIDRSNYEGKLFEIFSTELK